MEVVVIGRCTIDNNGGVTVYRLTETEQEQAMAALTTSPVQAHRHGASTRTGPEVYHGKPEKGQDPPMGAGPCDS